eukprot:g987.t1
MVTEPPAGVHVMTRPRELQQPASMWPTVWQVLIAGPEGTPWADSLLSIDVAFGKDYPFKPPTIAFKPPVYHCNVREDDQVCNELLRSAWIPAMTVESIVMSLISLLKSPVLDSPERPELAEEYQQRREEFDRKAREQAQKSQAPVRC